MFDLIGYAMQQKQSGSANADGLNGLPNAELFELSNSDIISVAPIRKLSLHDGTTFNNVALVSKDVVPYDQIISYELVVDREHNIYKAQFYVTDSAEDKSWYSLSAMIDNAACRFVVVTDDSELNGFYCLLEDMAGILSFMNISLSCCVKDGSALVCKNKSVGWGSNALTVSLYDSSMTADRTHTEIFNAVESGIPVVGVFVTQGNGDMAPEYDLMILKRSSTNHAIWLKPYIGDADPVQYEQVGIELSIYDPNELE